MPRAARRSRRPGLRCLPCLRPVFCWGRLRSGGRGRRRHSPAPVAGGRPALVKLLDRTAAVRAPMAKDAIVSQELADKFKTEKDSPYLRFVRSEGLDIISAQYVAKIGRASCRERE